MKIAPALAFAALTVPLLGASGVMAGSYMHQSPVLMRRAGPSCTPGHLGGAKYAGYLYQRGPCRGPDPSYAVGGRAKP